MIPQGLAQLWGDDWTKQRRDEMIGKPFAQDQDLLAQERDAEIPELQLSLSLRRGGGRGGGGGGRMPFQLSK